MRRVKKELSLVDSYRFNKCCYKDVEARINEWMKDYIVANPYSSSCDPVKKRQQWQLTLENKKKKQGSKRRCARNRARSGQSNL